MNTINFIIGKQHDVKYTSKNPDTGDIKISNEAYDKQKDEILENILYQTSIKQK